MAKETVQIVHNGKVVGQFDVNETPTPSATGKSLTVASSRGNQPIDMQVNGKQVICGLNLYIKK